MLSLENVHVTCVNSASHATCHARQCNRPRPFAGYDHMVQERKLRTGAFKKKEDLSLSDLNCFFLDVPVRSLRSSMADFGALLGVLGIRDNWANYLRDKG